MTDERKTVRLPVRWGQQRDIPNLPDDTLFVGPFNFGRINEAVPGVWYAIERERECRNEPVLCSTEAAARAALEAAVLAMGVESGDAADATCKPCDAAGHCVQDGACLDAARKP